MNKAGVVMGALGLLSGATGSILAVTTSNNMLSKEDAAAQYVPLTAEGKVAVAQLPFDNLEFKGTSTTLPRAAGARSGQFYIIGSPAPEGWNTGDYAVFDGNDWVKIENQVASVAGKKGAVTLVSKDVTDFPAEFAKLLAEQVGTTLVELDSNGKVPIRRLPLSGLHYKGVVDEVPSAAGTQGDMYIVKSTGDWVVFDGARWETIPNYNAVTSVAGRQGHIDLQTSDLKDWSAATAGFGAGGPAGPPGSAGPAGQQGAAGPPGPVGPPGSNGLGIQGATGEQGPVGTSGATGPSGPVGEAGVQGPAGPTGPQGNSGVAGPQGEAGPPGPTGPALQIKAFVATAPPPNSNGYAEGDLVFHEPGNALYMLKSAANNEWTLVSNAFEGVAGPQGLPGPAGPAGAAGLLGPAGPSGPTGSSGAQGPQGAVGSEGARGPSGPAGLTGPVGPPGLQGPAGPALGVKTVLSTPLPVSGYAAGDVVFNDTDQKLYILKSEPAGWVEAASDFSSVAGPRGDVGPTGPVGPPGPLGATGPSGPRGPTGSQGALGPTGAPGPAGPAGSPGISGPVGPQGPVGPALGVKAVVQTLPTLPFGDFVVGDMVYNETDHTIHIVRDLTASGWREILTTLTSIVGPQGSPGAQGVKGDAGAAGAQGPTGATGPAGPQGPSGTSGLEGPRGPQGLQGEVGSAGPAGISGPVGPVGPALGVKAFVTDVPQTTGGFAAGDLIFHTADSKMYVATSEGQWVVAAESFTSVAGPKGDKGEPGAAGAQGAQGPQGLQGVTGSQGLQGALGPTGAVGPAGPVGNAGPQGLQGVQGPPGPALTISAFVTGDSLPPTGYATGDLVFHETRKKLYALKSVQPNSWVEVAQNFSSVAGPAGTPGAQGPAGAPGPVGVPGPEGALGPQGPQGTTGPQGPAGTVVREWDPVSNSPHLYNPNTDQTNANVPGNLYIVKTSATFAGDGVAYSQGDWVLVDVQKNLSRNNPVGVSQVAGQVGGDVTTDYLASQLLEDGNPLPNRSWSSSKTQAVLTTSNSALETQVTTAFTAADAALESKLSTETTSELAKKFAKPSGGAAPPNNSVPRFDSATGELGFSGVTVSATNDVTVNGALTANTLQATGMLGGVGQVVKIGSGGLLEPGGLPAVGLVSSAAVAPFQLRDPANHETKVPVATATVLKVGDVVNLYLDEFQDLMTTTLESWFITSEPLVPKSAGTIALFGSGTDFWATKAYFEKAPDGNRWKLVLKNWSAGIGACNLQYRAQSSSALGVPPLVWGQTFEVDAPKVLNAVVQRVQDDSPFDVVLNFNEAILETAPPTIKFGNGDTYTLERVTPAQYRKTGLTMLAGFRIDDGDIVVEVAAAQDLVGNPMTLEMGIVAVRDNAPPTLVSKAPAAQTTFRNGSTIPFQCRFSEELKQAPTLTLMQGTSSLATVQMTKSTTVSHQYEHSHQLSASDTPHADGTITVTVAGVEDVAGNVLQPVQWTLERDSTGPILNTLVTAPARKLNASETLTITATYDEGLQQAPELTGLLGAAPSPTSDTAKKIWTWDNVPLSGYETQQYTVTASKAVDLAGNEQAGAASTTFEVDTVVPTVATASFDRSPPNYKQGDTATLTVTFSKELRLEPAPTVSFAGTVEDSNTAHALTPDASDSKIWRLQYTLSGTGNDDDTKVRVSGATDEAGNVIVPDSEIATLVVDNTAPTIVDDITNSAGRNFLVQGDQVHFVVKFDEDIKVAPTLTLSGSEATQTLNLTKTSEREFTTADLYTIQNGPSTNGGTETLNVEAKGAVDYANHTMSPQTTNFDVKKPFGKMVVTLADGTTSKPFYEKDDALLLKFNTDVELKSVPQLGLSGATTLDATNLTKAEQPDPNWTETWTLSHTLPSETTDAQTATCSITNAKFDATNFITQVVTPTFKIDNPPEVEGTTPGGKDRKSVV